MGSFSIENIGSKRITIGNDNTYDLEPDLLTTTTPSIDKNPNWTIDNIYPIGSIYFSIDPTNPTAYFGGTWENFAPGRCLVCVDSSSSISSFKNDLRYGGTTTETLNINKMPSHRHQEDQKEKEFGNTGGTVDLARNYRPDTYTGANIVSTSVGGGAAHTNVQPYYTCYMWLRIA